MNRRVGHMEPRVVIKPTNDLERRQNTVSDALAIFGPLPDGLRLLCYFDHEDWWEFKNEDSGFGMANRAVSFPVSKSQDWTSCPPELVACCYGGYSSNDTVPMVDFVTYLHNSSCENPIALTMSFTHELQHFVQYATMRKTWNTNIRLKEWSRDFETGVESHELPFEKDARGVSKRCAIKLYGPESIEDYINDRIEKAVNELDRRDWRFVKELEISTPYDLELESVLLSERLSGRTLARKAGSASLTR